MDKTELDRASMDDEPETLDAYLDLRGSISALDHRLALDAEKGWFKSLWDGYCFSLDRSGHLVDAVDLRSSNVLYAWVSVVRCQDGNTYSFYEGHKEHTLREMLNRSDIPSASTVIKALRLHYSVPKGEGKKVVERKEAAGVVEFDVVAGQFHPKD